MPIPNFGLANIIIGVQWRTLSGTTNNLDLIKKWRSILDSDPQALSRIIKLKHNLRSRTDARSAHSARTAPIMPVRSSHTGSLNAICDTPKPKCVLRVSAVMPVRLASH